MNLTCFLFSAPTFTFSASFPSVRAGSRRLFQESVEAYLQRHGAAFLIAQRYLVNDEEKLGLFHGVDEPRDLRIIAGHRCLDSDLRYAGKRVLVVGPVKVIFYGLGGYTVFAKQLLDLLGDLRGAGGYIGGVERLEGFTGFLRIAPLPKINLVPEVLILGPQGLRLWSARSRPQQKHQEAEIERSHHGHPQDE